MDQPASPLDDALALLATLTPVQRARVLSAFLDGRNLKRWGAMRAELVHDLAAAGTYAAVAEQLGVGVKAVQKAVTQHRHTLAADASPMDTSE